MKTGKHTIALYWKATTPYWRSGLVVVATTIAAVLINNIAAPYAISQVLASLAEVASGGDASGAYYWLKWLVVSVAAAFFVWGTVGFVDSWRQSKILRDLDVQIFNHLSRQSYTFFANRFGGALVAQAGRFVRSYEHIEDILFFDILTTATRIVASLIVLLLSIPTIGLALLGWVVLFLGSVIWLTAKKQPIARQASDADSVVTARLADVITNILTVKSLGRRHEEAKQFTNIANRRQRLRYRSWWYDELIRRYQTIMIGLFEVLIIWLSIQAVTNHKASLAIVLLAQFYVLRITADLWEAGGIMKRVSASLADAAEMTQILGIEPEVKDVPNPKPLIIKQGKVQFKHATFGWPGNPRVFRDFSLTIKPGEKVGLVGRSGGGKTTLTKLLLRFADVQRGEILIDGQTISKVRQDELRRAVAYVPQEPILFHRSLTENIRYGRPEATDEEIREAARLAHAAEFIEALPEQYDTLVGERGVKLSGGEKQRVAIARAMLSQAPILVLDEATSSLDSKSEKLITEALKRLMAKRTTIVIAHRLSTIRNLDRILVLEGGKVVEQGTHRELLNKGGVYAELWAHQSGGFLGEESDSQRLAEELVETNQAAVPINLLRARDNKADQRRSA